MKTLAVLLATMITVFGVSPRPDQGPHPHPGPHHLLGPQPKPRPGPCHGEQEHPRPGLCPHPKPVPEPEHSGSDQGPHPHPGPHHLLGPQPKPRPGPCHGDREHRRPGLCPHPKPEPEPEPEPEPTTAAPKPEPTTAALEPVPTTAALEPEPTTAAPEPEPTTAALKPAPTTAALEPTICTHKDGKKWEEGKTYSPQVNEVCSCDSSGKYRCSCQDKGEACSGNTPVAWFNDKCEKTCVPEYGVCSASADPHYTTFDGASFNFKGDCKYNFYSCGDIAIYADHEKNKASTHTKSLEVVFKNDLYGLKDGLVTINGDSVVVPLHKTYGDGSVIQVSNLGDYHLTITQDGKNPLLELTWNKKASYSVSAHGTCKGKSNGLCGTWNDSPSDDFKTPKGEIAGTAEIFGTSWALDDEQDCPEPDPPVDICTEFGVDKDAATDHMTKVLSSGSLKRCTAEVDTASTIENGVQEICNCFGDTSCSCPTLEQYAVECEAHGFNVSTWQMDNDFTVCKPDCPTGTTFYASGPKPAATCSDPDGGDEQQKGCFCPRNTVMEDGICIEQKLCKCEYAGKLYSAGDVYTKEGECLSCTCIGAAKEQCEEIGCKNSCSSSEIEVAVEGQCCPECMADWITAVNPAAAGKMQEPLELACQVKGVTITKDNVKWYTFNPGEKDITNFGKTYSLSGDGLTLTIKSMNGARKGNYKCVVSKDEKQSEGLFVVTLPIVHVDLIEPSTDFVELIEGKKLILEVKKLGGKITQIWWECKGARMLKSMDRITIQNKGSSNRLIFNPAMLEDAGSCICYADGLGSQDNAEIAIVVA